MGLPSKGTLYSTAAIALAMAALTTCTSINLDKKHANGNEQEKQGTTFTKAIDSSVTTATKTPIAHDDETTGVTPPFMPQRHIPDTAAVDTQDSTKVQSPFAEAIDKALKGAKKPLPKTDGGSPPFIPKHQEPEEP